MIALKTTKVQQYKVAPCTTLYSITNSRMRQHITRKSVIEKNKFQQEESPVDDLSIVCQ